MNLLEEFLGIIDTLNAAHIEYAVCGGMALQKATYLGKASEIRTKKIELRVPPLGGPSVPSDQLENTKTA